MESHFSLLFFAFSMLRLAANGDAVPCADPGTPIKGSRTLIRRSEYQPGTVVRFQCNYSFHLKGAPKAECLNNGLWSRKLPTCMDNCNNTCLHDGVCVASRGWTDSERSYRCVCREEYVGKFCGTRLCTDTPQVQYATIELIRGGQEAHKYTEESVIQYTCHTSFELHGSSRLTCNSQGQWTPEAPFCRATQCLNQYNEPSFELENGGYTNAQRSYTTGTEISFYCNKGYRLVGHSKVACSRNGYWVPYNWPSCEAGSCPPVYLIPNGYYHLDSQSRVLGARVRYFCKLGYYRWGPGELNCVAGSPGHLAKWSPEQVPECITQADFVQRCDLQGKIMSSISLTCIPLQKGKTCINCKQPQTMAKQSLTIVTAASGSFLVMLLIVVAVVAFQRRRLMRRLRRSAHRPRLGSRASSDQMRFVYYSSNNLFLLPSYDEAMRSSVADPPPFDSESGTNQSDAPLASSNAETQQRDASSSDTTEDDGLYEAINDSPVTASSSAAENSTTISDNASQTTARQLSAPSAIEVAEDALKDDSSSDENTTTSDTAPLLSDE